MKEHALLDAWLRLADQAITSPNSTHITYVAAKEELRKFEVREKEADLFKQIKLRLLSSWKHLNLN